MAMFRQRSGEWRARYSRKGIGEQTTPRCARAPGQTFRTVKEFTGNGDGGLHTKRITEVRSDGQGAMPDRGWLSPSGFERRGGAIGRSIVQTSPQSHSQKARVARPPAHLKQELSLHMKGEGQLLGV